MKKLSMLLKVMAVAVVVAVIIFLLTSVTASARGGGHHGGGHRGGGGCLWGGLVVGTIIGAITAPLYTRTYVPACYDRVVRQEYYVRDAYGNFVRVPPTVIRECY